MTAAGKDRVTLYVSEAGKYAIRFYAPNGRLVKSLAPRRVDHGYNIVTLPQPLAEGLYTVRITGDRFSRTQAVYSR
jgi:hypothetical protein